MWDLSLMGARYLPIDKGIGVDSIRSLLRHLGQTEGLRTLSRDTIS
ncbi:MAG: hypothetical protein ACI957_005146 [Verrucomicrobiales bacterium]|jgi:hypothetical protein